MSASSGLVGGALSLYINASSTEPPQTVARAPYLSPEAIAVDRERTLVYTALTTAKAVSIADYEQEKVTGRIELSQNPNELLLSPDANTLYVSTGTARGTVEIFELPSQKHKASIALGHTPTGLALSKDGKTLYVANRYNATIAVIDLAQGKVSSNIPVIREPRSLLLTPDGKTLAVGNFLPNMPGNGENVSAEISLIDTSTKTVRANISLANGAQAVRGLALSPDARYLYSVHLVSRFTAPITQLDRGWVNTDAVSIIDINEAKLYATILIDDAENGAANPAGICVDQGGKLNIALNGDHELLILDLAPLHVKIAAHLESASKIADPETRKEALDLSRDLAFAAPFKRRIPLNGRCPTGIASIGTGDTPTFLISSRFSTALEKVTTTPGKSNKATIRTIVLGTEPPPDAVRRGEFNFSDASVCFQRWLSCTSCHPDGRQDGINWDQMNDGLGNPKSTKSMLFTHYTPPVMITGIRPSAVVAVRKGIEHVLFTRLPEEFAADIDEYLKSLRPEESPYLPEYRARDPQGKGKELFENSGCSNCHSGEYLTDMKLHNVGTGTDNDKDRRFDTPTLREVWRTAPYLYDGRAVTIKEVLTTYNKEDAHGITSNLTKEEIELLALYVNTL
ncbi:MAG: beta-propeller fold lactonase family protein [Puniceicoccales bacterium]|nr:beta-propeller fold lactonase family protein [Puniceicoccales bacterium]